MTQSNNSFSTQQTSPRSADARMLTSMIQRVHDPVIARIFLSTSEQYPDLQLQFLGAYLKAQETVKRSQIRYAKHATVALPRCVPRTVLLHVVFLV